MKLKIFGHCPHCRKEFGDNYEEYETTVWVLTNSLSYMITHKPCKGTYQIRMPFDIFVTIKEGVHIDMQKRKENDFLK